MSNNKILDRFFSKMGTRPSDGDIQNVPFFQNRLLAEETEKLRKSPLQVKWPEEDDARGEQNEAFNTAIKEIREKLEVAYREIAKLATVGERLDIEEDPKIPQHSKVAIKGLINELTATYDKYTWLEPGQITPLIDANLEALEEAVTSSWKAPKAHLLN